MSYVTFDARQKKSRAKIISSLCTLLESKQFGDISMSEIASSAGTSRQTLYTHFATKSEIVQAYMEGWFTTVQENFRAAPPPDPGNEQAAFAAFLTRIIHQNGQDYHMRRVIFSGQAGTEALAQVRTFVVSLLAARLSGQADGPLPEALRIFALFAAFGVTGVTDALADGTLDSTPEDIADALSGFVYKGMQGVN